MSPFYPTTWVDSMCSHHIYTVSVRFWTYMLINIHFTTKRDVCFKVDFSWFEIEHLVLTRIYIWGFCWIILRIIVWGDFWVSWAYKSHSLGSWYFVSFFPFSASQGSDQTLSYSLMLCIGSWGPRLAAQTPINRAPGDGAWVHRTGYQLQDDATAPTVPLPGALHLRWEAPRRKIFIKLANDSTMWYG